MKSIAFIGTGLMGNPMVMRLIQAGYSLYVYNRTRAKAKNLQKAGANVAGSPQNAINAADCIIIMVSDGLAVKQVLPLQGEKLNGKTVIQMSTIAPGENQEIAQEIQKQGGTFLEAPVLGSINEAVNGSLFVMVGGQKKLLEAHEDILARFAREIIYVGEVGKASALKLALNQLIASLTASFSLSLGYVRRNDVPVESFMHILRQSALFAPTFDKKLDNMLKRDFSKTNFSTRHLLKDVQLINKDVERCGLNNTVINAIEKIVQTAVAKGLSEMDYSSIYNAIDPG